MQLSVLTVESYQRFPLDEEFPREGSTVWMFYTVAPAFRVDKC